MQGAQLRMNVGSQGEPEETIGKNTIKMDNENVLVLLTSKESLEVVNHILSTIFLTAKQSLYVELMYHFNLKFEVASSSVVEVEQTISDIAIFTL